MNGSAAVSHNTDLPAASVPSGLGQSLSLAQFLGVRLASNVQSAQNSDASAAESAAANVVTATSAAQSSGGPVFERRNRNPNWTDTEINNFLDMLQEDNILHELVAQRTRHVFSIIAERLSKDGAVKSWDQCRIKLKNLKSQYRFIKERIPAIEYMDFDDETALRELLRECTSRGISPSSVKHIRYLRSFLYKLETFKRFGVVPPASGVGSSGQSSESDVDKAFADTAKPVTNGNASSHAETNLPTNVNKQHVQKMAKVSPHVVSDGSKQPLANRKRPNITISSSRDELPPGRIRRTEISPGITITAHHPTSVNVANNIATAAAVNTTPLSANSCIPTPPGQAADSNPLMSSEHGERFIEQFNQEMMDKFLTHQRQLQANFSRWEAERQRTHELAMARWRQEAREQEREMFTMFIKVMSECNQAMSSMLKISSAAVLAATGHSNSVEALTSLLLNRDSTFESLPTPMQGLDCDANPDMSSQLSSLAPSASSARQAEPVSTAISVTPDTSSLLMSALTDEDDDDEEEEEILDEELLDEDVRESVEDHDESRPVV